MKINIFSFFLLTFLQMGLYAQNLKDITLPEPVKTGGMPLMEALNLRQTKRAFSDKELSLQEVSNLLWAAFGINRPEDGKRTAPSAINAQEIDIYVSLKSGIYVYLPKENILKAVAAGDFRKNMGRQAFVGEAALVLIYVADYSKMSSRLNDERKAFYAATDTGFISQNVYLFAASENMATVVIGAFVDADVRNVIPLEEHQKVVLTQAIGFPN